jgi:hypothetical protein
MFRRSRGRGKIANGLELTQQSFAALRANPFLLVFPFISTIAIIIASLLFLVPAIGILISAAGMDAAASTTRAASSDDASTMTTVAGVVLGFIYYFILYTITIFSNTALIGCVVRLLRGETATVSDGIRIAMSRLNKILIFAAISATVGTIANAIRDSGREGGLVGAIIGSIVGGLLQGAWNLVVFFALPVMVVENIPIMDVFKRSVSLFKQTWGEGFVGSTAIGGIGCFINLAIIVVFGALAALALSINAPALAGAAAIVGFVLLVLVSLVTSTLNSIFQASLYQFATTGDAGPFIDNRLAASAFAA